MVIHEASDLRDGIDRIYVSRIRERGFVSIEDCVDVFIQGLKEYIKKRKERIITASI